MLMACLSFVQILFVRSGQMTVIRGRSTGMGSEGRGEGGGVGGRVRRNSPPPKDVRERCEVLTVHLLFRQFSFERARACVSDP